ncbi:hypothetical protein PENSPDRAFT_630683, partial [Peniophora sp. CONT]
MAAAQELPTDPGFGDEKAAMLQPTLPAPVQADVETVKLSRRRRFRRFGHIFLVFTGLYLVLNHFSHGPFEPEVYDMNRYGCGRTAISFPTLITGATGWSDDGVDAQCVNDVQSWKTDGPFTGHGSRDVYSAQVDFELAPSSFGYLLESVGDLQHLSPTNGSIGSIAFVSSPSAASENVSIGVHVTYSDPSVLNMLRVCNVQAGDEAGVVLGGLRSHRRFSADPMFSIGIRVTVPQEGLSSEIKTKLTGFTHDVYPGVNLGSLDIVTDRPVRFQ